MQLILQNGETIEIAKKRSWKAKRIIIRISANKGVELIIPARASEKKAKEFLNNKSLWVINKYNEIKQRIIDKSIFFSIGARIPIMGEFYTITHSGLFRGISYIKDDNLVISGDIASIERKAKDFLIKLAKAEITKIADIKARQVGKNYKKIRLKDTSSRWGSCSTKGNLSFSWRLIMAPVDVMNYVVCHEIAHLKEHNHSAKFWHLVSVLCPDYEVSYNWLKNKGNSLHLYGVSNLSII